MKELKIPLIKNGTVIDHITSGVLRILNIPQNLSSTVSVAINVKSHLGNKDIVKVENRELDTSEVDKIALIAPKATINIIRNYEVAEKHRVELPSEIIGIVSEVAEKHRVEIPSEIIGIVSCSNPTCVSNYNEPVKSRFKVINKDPPQIKVINKDPPQITCYYCEREPEDISERII